MSLDVVLRRTQIALPPEFCGQIQQGCRILMLLLANTARVTELTK